MGIPRVYRKSGERIIASYDYFNIAEGTGIKKFLGAKIVEEGVISGELSTEIFYSEEIETVTSEITETSSYVKHMDLDFDLTNFNIPKTIGGTAYISFTGKARGTEGAGDGVIYFNAIIKKVINGDETDIISSSTVVDESGASTRLKLYTIKLTIPQTRFEKGSILRITLEVYGKYTGSPAGNVKFIYAIGHDPQNRDGVEIIPSIDDPKTITKIEVFIPFRLDL